MTSPRVSIGMPVYNGGRFLTEALDSILAQEFGDFEVLISDNSSTDETRGICEDYARRDARITYLRQAENRGAAYNYNTVFERTSGEFFKWATHDDLLLPGFLGACLAAQDNETAPPALVYPASVFIDERGAVIGQDRDRLQAESGIAAIRALEVLQGMNRVVAIAGLFRRDVLARTRLIGSFISSDYVLLLETALLGRILRVEGPPLFQRRIHAAASRKANTSDSEVLRWFDPGARDRISATQRLYLEYMRSVFGLEGLGWPGRLACAGAVATGVGTKRLRVLAGRWRQKLSEGGWT